jgi:ferric-dicitrate binding protein FerR (iron transport regulator)
MEQNEFIDILRKYRQGDATPEERKLVDEWYAAMGKDARAISEEPELERLYQSSIYPYVKISGKGKVRKLRWYSVGIAASILLMVISYFFVVDFQADGNKAIAKRETSSSWKDMTNTTQSTQVIVLPDSSKVSLKPESNLKFSFSGTAREVHLKGEAFFEVKHNPDVPFFVHANEVTTKVLGTSFIIKAIEREQRVTVVVKTGKVSVYTSGEQEQASSAEAIILTPNQQIVFDTKVKEITKTLVENPQIVIPREQVRLMRFEEAPVAAIFKALEKAYGVKIEFDEAIFSSCELTTVISEDGIYNRLDIICDAIGTTYKLLEDRIAISGTGCNTERDD